MVGATFLTGTTIEIVGSSAVSSIITQKTYTI
jgi:hypothetical protein